MYARKHGFLEDIASSNILAGGLQEEEEEEEEDEINEGSNVGLYHPIMVRYLFVWIKLILAKKWMKILICIFQLNNEWKS